MRGKVQFDVLPMKTKVACCSSSWSAGIGLAIIHISPGTFASKVSILIARLFHSSSIVTNHFENSSWF